MVWLVDDSDGGCCYIARQANEMKQDVRYTIAAEEWSLQEELEYSVYCQQMIEEICDSRSKIEVLPGNIEVSLSIKLVDDKRLHVDVAAIQELLEMNDVHVYEGKVVGMEGPVSELCDRTSSIWLSIVTSLQRVNMAAFLNLHQSNKCGKKNDAAEFPVVKLKLYGHHFSVIFSFHIFS